MSQHTVRRRLDFAVDQDCQIAKSLPFIAKDAVKKDEELEIRQAEKKLKTSIVTINNNVVPVLRILLPPPRLCPGNNF